MTVRYERSARRKNARYVCQREGIERAEKKICQSVPGTEIEPAVADLLIQTMTPVSLEVAISVQQELQFRLDEADSIRKKQVERARYESDLARQRFMRVDPNNRLVADSLEADWNEKLRALSESQAAYEKQTAADLKSLDEAKKAEILKLATDFPKLWRDQSLPDRERKRIVRLLLEDVTLIRGEQMQITAHVRFKGGVTRTLEFGRPKAAWELRQTDPAVIREIDQLTSDHTDQEIAELLNNMSVKSGEGLPFTRKRVYVLKREYNLESRYGRLRRTGLLTRREISIRLKVTEGTIKNWRRAGLLRGTPYNDKNGFLYDPPGKDAPIKGKWKKPGIRSKKQETPTQSTKEKQYA